jgi:hypothetical protein
LDQRVVRGAGGDHGGRHAWVGGAEVAAVAVQGVPGQLVGRGRVGVTLRLSKWAGDGGRLGVGSMVPVGPGGRHERTGAATDASIGTVYGIGSSDRGGGRLIFTISKALRELIRFVSPRASMKFRTFG